jgi:hypothetical protein
MSTNILRGLKVFGAGFMLATLMASFVAYSQEAPTADGVTEQIADESDGLEPAVNTSADESSDADMDAMEPGVPSAVLAQDVTRSQSGNQVMDRMELGRTEITGNQELPKVMYIVPWKKADPGDLTGKPVNTLLDEVLAPLDREEFIRQVDYYGDLYED